MGTIGNDILEQRTNGDTKRVAGIIVVREQPDGTHRVLALLPGKEVADDSGETRYEFYRNWDIPKGHGKGGEPAMTIAMREAGEEAGYTTDNLDFRWGTQSKAVTGKKGKTGAFFVAHSDVDPTLRRNPENGMLEHGGFKWVTWNDMLGNVGGFWFGDAIKWARDLVDPHASDELGEGLLRTWVREILAEAPRRGKRHDAARREREELESQGIFPTKEEKPKETKRDLWHIGPKPAFPQPKVKLLQDWDPEAIGRDGEKGDFVDIPGTDNWQRWWLDSPVKAGVFLTPTPTDIARYHGRSGNVYHYKVPEWVIAKSGGVHRYDHGSELLISKETWEEAGDEIEFVGRSMTKDQLWQKIRDLGGYDFGGRVTPPGKSKPGSFNLYGLRQTKHPRDAIKLMTDKERKAALAALEDLYPAPTGQNPETKWEKVPGSRRGIPLNWFEERMSKKDLELRDLLLTSLKSVNEATIRQYVREMLLEKASGGRILDRVTRQMSRSIIARLKDPNVRDRHAKLGEDEVVTLRLTDVEKTALEKAAEEGEKLELVDANIINNLKNVERIAIILIATDPDKLGWVDVGAEGAYIYNPADRSSSELQVGLWLPRNYEFNIFSMLIPGLKERIRHELEHTVQSTETLGSRDIGEDKRFDSPEALVQYYTKGGELAAHVVGFYKKAKSVKASVLDLIDEFLVGVYHQASDAGMTEADAGTATGQVRNIWLCYLVNRYPRTREYLDMGSLDCD